MRFFRCVCGEEALIVETQDDTEWINICFWRRAGLYESFRQRLRHCWKILRTGSPYGDQITLDQQTAQELAEYLEGVVKQGCCATKAD